MSDNSLTIPDPNPQGNAPVDLDKAQALSAVMLNQTRTVKAISLPQSAILAVPAAVRTKFALLMVLSTKLWLGTKDIEELLERLLYKRGRSSIRRGLSRLVKFGFADVRKNHDSQHSKSWQLTQRGYQYANSAQAQQAATPKIGKTRRLKGAGGTQKSSKGSSGRQSTMCIDPSKPTFNKAVENTVCEFTSQQHAFSAYDITQAVRKKANDGTSGIDIAETGTVHVNGKDVPKVDHELVKGIVTELFNTGAMVGYDRTHNGTFFQYGPIAQSAPPAPATPSTSDPSTPPAGAGGNYDGSPTL